MTRPTGGVGLPVTELCIDIAHHLEHHSSLHLLGLGIERQAVQIVAVYAADSERGRAVINLGKHGCSMTITLHLKPEQEANILAQAQAGGKTPEEYILSMVEGAISPKSKARLTPEQRAAAFEAWSAGHRHTPPLSDYAVSRESIYEEHDAG